MFEKMDLIEEIHKIPKTSKIFLTSYSFDLNFFEKYIFSRFKNKTYPLVFIDYKDYISNIGRVKSKNVETKYFLAPIKINNAFHPKIILATDEKQLKLIVGSSNITPKGYAHNAEINCNIEIKYENNQYLGMINSIKDFLEGIASITKSTPHKDRLEKLLQNIPDDKEVLTEDVIFLHNFKKPILDQVFERIEEDIESFIVISPFFSQKKSFYDRIIEKINCPIQLILQKENNNVPIDVVKSYKNDQIVYNTLSFNQTRKLHAKIIIIKTSKRSYCLFGSSNFTKPALSLTPFNGGNVEANLLIKEEDPNFFDYLLHDDQLKIKSNKLENIDSINLEFPSKSKFDFRITETKIENDELVIKFDKQIIKDTQLIINIDSLSEPLTKKINSNEISIKLNDEQLEKLRQSSVLSLEIKDEDNSYSSDYKWIYNPQYFPEKFSMLNGIKNRDESRWLLSILSKLSKLPSLSTESHFIPILEEMNAIGLFDNLSTMEKEEKIERINKKIEKIASKRTTLDDVIEKFTHRHENRMKKSIESNNLTDLKIVLNSFMMVNKLILWSVIHEYKEINYLRKIRTNFRMINDYLKNQRMNQNLESKLDERFLSHLLYVTYIVDRLQVYSPNFDQKDLLKQVFEKTFGKTINLVINKFDKNIEKIPIEEFYFDFDFIRNDIKLERGTIMSRIKDICRLK